MPLPSSLDQLRHGFRLCTLSALLLAAFHPGSDVLAADTTGSALLKKADQNSQRPGVSPVQRIERQRANGPAPVTAEDRTIDGRLNNLGVIDMNASGTPLKRAMSAHYSDDGQQMYDPAMPGARTVSNTVSAQAGSQVNRLGASDFLWQWGQFLDHDIDLTDGIDPPEHVNIAIPQGDTFFDPNGTGTAELVFNRSIYQAGTGSSNTNPRQQVNEITGWIDGSQVYGSDADRATALRTNDGTGKLKTSAGNLLPFNTTGLPNAGGSSDALFLAGDVRANEQLGLTAMHTLFVREHNRLATDIAARNPGLSDEQIYQQARRIVIGELQFITYNEFIPALLGPRALAPYRGYNPAIDARIMNEFSTAAYRLGHTLVSPTLLRIGATGQTIPEGNLQLRDAFFSPHKLAANGGIDPILRGLASQRCQEMDVFVVDDLRNFLFGPPGAGGFDLASLNIQRGRDHGLPRYNEARVAMGLSARKGFNEISSNPDIQTRLASAYASVDQVDLWVGGLAEDHLTQSQVGELFQAILAKQFAALRDGDRFWYARLLTPAERKIVENSRLSDVIRRNTSIGAELPQDVFHVRGSALTFGHHTHRAPHLSRR